MTPPPLRALVALSVLLGGCCLCNVDFRTPRKPPVPETYVVVVPSRSGHIGGVVVHAGDAEPIVLDTAYAAAHVNSNRVAERVPSPAAEQVAEEFAAVAQAKPEPPVSFTLYFDTAGDLPTAGSETVLKDVYAEVARRPGAEVTVIGHTDRVGSTENNDALSLRRAQHVREYLIRHGVPADTIGVAGRGEREPLVGTEDETSEPRNRRVEINVR